MHTAQGWFFTGNQAHVWPWWMGLFFPQALLYTNLTFPGWNTATACPHSKNVNLPVSVVVHPGLAIAPNQGSQVGWDGTRNKKPNSPYKNPSKYEEGFSPQMKGVLYLFGVVLTVNHTWNKTQQRIFACFVCGTKMVRIGSPWNCLLNVLTTYTSSSGVRQATKGIASKAD
jgi:hypothetical protein